MPAYPRDFYASLVDGTDAIFLARVVFADGAPITPEDIASATYTVSSRSCPNASFTPVVTHEERELDPAVVLYDSLQADAPWDVDSVGYNFRLELDPDVEGPFSGVGNTMELRVALLTVSGLSIAFRYQIEVL